MVGLSRRRSRIPMMLLAVLLAGCGGNSTPAPASPGASASHAAGTPLVTAPLPSAPVTPSPSLAAPSPSPSPAVPSPATPSPTHGSAAVEIPVVACATSYGVPSSPAPLPATERVTLPAVLASRLAVYANDVDRVLGPRGWTCAAQVGADGTSFLRVANPGDRAAAIAVSTDIGCVGCALDLACPLFATAARLLQETFGLACSATKPAREIATPESLLLVRFDDPAGVKGTGDGSGGPYPAHGYMYFDSAGPSAARITCVVGDADADLCAPILDAWKLGWTS